MSGKAIISVSVLKPSQAGIPFPLGIIFLTSVVTFVQQKKQLEDARLVAMTLSGDRKAFEVLVRRYQKLVYNVAYKVVWSHEIASDITQDAFMKAYRALHSFRTESSFKPWLLRITSNTALNWIRDHKSYDSLDATLEENPQFEPSANTNVEREVEFKISHGLLIDALAQLPARHRNDFVLRYEHDLSYEEISQIIDESESTVKSLLFRTRERLRKLLLERMRR